MHSLAGFFACLALVGSTAAQIYPANWPGVGLSVSPNYPWLFEFPLPIPADISPLYTANVNGTPVNYYELTIGAFQKRIYPNLGPANMVGYNGISPGPTFSIPVGTESIVRVTNNSPGNASTHLHGAWTRSPWDGWADQMINPNQFKDYYYSGSQSGRTLWYHDHANHHTAGHSYYGQMGFHIITDASEDSLQLPTGKYDIPLALEDKIYQDNGDLASPDNETVNYFGDTIHVNGQPWPYLAVEPRKYRFRWLNAGLSRPYELFYMTNDGAWRDFQVIGSDGGLFGAPVTTNSLEISMGERYDIVFDFAPFASQNITVGNDMRLVDINEFANTNKVLRLVVGTTVTDTANNAVPATLVDQAALPQEPPPRAQIDHVFNFQRTESEWTINGVDYDDVNNRVLARPPMGTVERWQLRYAAGPGVHPVHIHLVDFIVANRTGGARGVLPYEAAGTKDVVLLMPGEVVDVVARYGPWNGLYMFHCHNLVHEDHEMMDVLNVTALPGLGYDLRDVLAFDDPSDERFAPVDVEGSLYEREYVTGTVIPGLAGSGAYRDPLGLLRAEEAGSSSAGGAASTASSSTETSSTASTTASESTTATESAAGGSTTGSNGGSGISVSLGNGVSIG